MDWTLSAFFSSSPLDTGLEISLSLLSRRGTGWIDASSVGSWSTFAMTGMSVSASRFMLLANFVTQSPGVKREEDYEGGQQSEPSNGLHDLGATSSKILLTRHIAQSIAQSPTGY